MDESSYFSYFVRARILACRFCSFGEMYRFERVCRWGFLRMISHHHSFGQLFNTVHLPRKHQLLCRFVRISVKACLMLPPFLSFTFLCAKFGEDADTVGESLSVIVKLLVLSLHQERRLCSRLAIFNGTIP